jgi:hypothetical protein
MNDFYGIIKQSIENQKNKEFNNRINCVKFY